MGDNRYTTQLLEVTIAAPAGEPYTPARILDSVAWELHNSSLPYEVVSFSPASKDNDKRKHYGKRTVHVQLKRVTPELQDDVCLRRTVTAFMERLDKYLGEDVFVSYKMVLLTAAAKESHTA